VSAFVDREMGTFSEWVHNRGVFILYFYIFILYSIFFSKSGDLLEGAHIEEGTQSRHYGTHTKHTDTKTHMLEHTDRAFTRYAWCKNAMLKYIFSKM